MSFYEALKLAFSSILSHKLRSFLTLLGVIFGVATVIVFLAESTSLALLGGAIGVLIAYSIAKLVAVAFSIPTALPLVWVSIALFVSSSVGLISGVYPAWKAARLDPIEALRAE